MEMKAEMMKVLLINPDPSLLTEWEGALEGHTVITTTKARVSFDLFLVHQESLDIIVIPHHAADGSMVDFVRIIRLNYHFSGMILLTSSDPELKQFLELGKGDCVVDNVQHIPTFVRATFALREAGRLPAFARLKAS